MAKPGGNAGYTPLQGPQAAAPVRSGLGYTALAMPRSGGEREWKGEWWHCCGDCGCVGWCVCCATTLCMPCVFGFVKYHAFGSLRKAIAWGVPYFILWAASRYLVYLVVLLDVSMTNDELKGTPPQEVLDGKTYKALIMYDYVIIALGFGIVAIGAWNRMKMRKKFDIPHRMPTLAGLDDLVLWFLCEGPALCQETRTIIHNNIEGGVWRGPDAMLMEPAQNTIVMAEGEPVLPYVPPQRELMTLGPMQGSASTAERAPLLPQVPPMATASPSHRPIDAAVNNA